MNYLQNKLYCLTIYLIILISFIIFNPININGQTDNDELLIDGEQTFDNEKNIENKDALIEKNITVQNELVEENITAQNTLIEKDVKGQDALIEKNITAQNTLIEENRTIINNRSDIE